MPALDTSVEHIGFPVVTHQLRKVEVMQLLDSVRKLGEPKE